MVDPKCNPNARCNRGMRPLFYGGVLLLVAGCATRSPSPPAYPAPSPAVPEARAPAPPAAPKPSPLAAEQRWLTQLFEGTPVIISGDSDGALRLAVPLEHSFETSSNVPKPALKAVLDKVGQSLKRQPTSRLAIRAPGRERAQAARAHLLGRGVAKYRVTAEPAGAEGVVLRLSLAPAPVSRLEDAAPALAKQPGH